MMMPVLFRLEVDLGRLPLNLTLKTSGGLVQFKLKVSGSWEGKLMVFSNLV